MKRIRRPAWCGLLAALILLPLLAACGVRNTAASDLSAAEQRWKDGGLVNYRYTLQITCFCVAPANEQLVVEVRNGTTARITTAAKGEEVSSDQARRAGTVPDLFGIIRDAHERGADEVSVSYDEALGYPTRIRIDEFARAADDEAVYRVSDLTEIPAASTQPSEGCVAGILTQRLDRLNGYRRGAENTAPERKDAETQRCNGLNGSRTDTTDWC